MYLWSQIGLAKQNEYKKKKQRNENINLKNT